MMDFLPEEMFEKTGIAGRAVTSAEDAALPEEMFEKTDIAGRSAARAGEATTRAVDAMPDEEFEKTIARIRAGGAITLPRVPAAQEIVVHDAAAEAVKEMAAAMSGQISALAEMLRVTNERMAEMEKTIRTLEKVTPQQGLNINRAIRERAAEICQEYRMGVTEKAAFRANREKLQAVAVAIRRDVRAATGARSMQAVARCDYGTVIEMVTDWDDYEKVQAIKKGGGDR